MDGEVRIVRPSERVSPAVGAPGMRREEAFASEELWMGVTIVDPGVSTGWHHHGAHDTYVYVLSGVLDLEFGPGGAGRARAEVGDAVLVPAGVVHREGAAENGVEAVVIRTGQGPMTVEVEGPDEGRA